MFIISRAQLTQFKRDAHHLSLQIGLRPAARALGIKEDRIRQWAKRDNWQISLIRPSATNAKLSPNVTDGLEASRQILAQLGERTRFGLAIAGTKASEHLADLEAHKLVSPAHSISADQWSRVGDRVHGWSAERAKGAVVQVAVVPMPTDAERAERREMHDKLDAIAAKLREHPIP